MVPYPITLNAIVFMENMVADTLQGHSDTLLLSFTLDCNIDGLVLKSEVEFYWKLAILMAKMSASDAMRQQR